MSGRWRDNAGIIAPACVMASARFAPASVPRWESSFTTQNSGEIRGRLLRTSGRVGLAYDYVRPLATIEPTAIAAGLPVDASIGLTDIATLKTRLEDAKF